MNPELLYFRCIKKAYQQVVGEIYPGWVKKNGETVIALSERSTCTYQEGESWAEDFEPATAEDFEASIQRAIKAVDECRATQDEFMLELKGFSTNLIGSGEVTPANETTTIAAFQSAGQIRNRAHGLKRKANDLAVSVKEKKEWLETKLGQKMALAMASLSDMKDVVAKLEEVVLTVQLYLGHDEEVVLVRDGKPAPATVPLTIRQRVLAMDEEVALTHPHGIDCTEIEKFDEWLLASPENLKQVIPEEKAVVVLRVRRKQKDYEATNISEMLEAAGKNAENAKSYWLIRNGERIHRIWANIMVGWRLLPEADEVEHFFFERTGRGADAEEVPLRPGSRKYMEAMEQAGKVKRHFMRLALVLQGLIDRTQLFLPFTDDVRPNLLNPETWAGKVTYIRDVEAVITDGRPTFREWLKSVNQGVQHGHRIVGRFPTYFGKDDECRISPKNSSGVNDEDIHIVQEQGGELRFLFTRDDTVYRRGWREESGPAKTRGSYRIYPDDRFFVCIDHASVADMGYYLNDRRHRHDYENMVPALQKAIQVKQEEAKKEEPFRKLLLRKLTEATPECPVSEDQLDRLIKWWKTKTREHRALLKDDGKAYRMILARHIEQDGNPAAVSDLAAFKDALIRIPDALLAYRINGKDFGVLRPGGFTNAYLTEETWRVTRGTAHRVSVEEHVLAQKAHYEAYEVIQRSPQWDARPAVFSENKHLSPIHFPALVEWVKANPWRSLDEQEKIISIYMRYSDDETTFRAASFDMDDDSRRNSGWGRRDKERKRDILDRYDLPSGHERVVTWSGKRKVTFGYSFDYGSSTWIGGHGEQHFGWMNQGATPLFVDEKFLAEVIAAVPVREARNKEISKLCDWTREANAHAEAALLAAWRTKQYGIYSQQGGDPEFFEDHLKTLPKYDPECRFIWHILERALNAGASQESLCGLTLPQLIKAYPFVPEEEGDTDDEVPDDETMKALVAENWTVPPPAVEEPEDEE